MQARLLLVQARLLLARLPGLLQALPHALLPPALQHLTLAHLLVLPQRLALLPLLQSLLLPPLCSLLLSLRLPVRQQRLAPAPHVLCSRVLVRKLLTLLAGGLCQVAVPLPQWMAARLLPPLLPLPVAPALMPGLQPRQLHPPSALRLPPLPQL